MPLPGRPRNAGGTETRFRSAGQDGVGNKRWTSGPRDRFHARVRVFVSQQGQTPGLQDIEPAILGTVAFGTIRRLWRQSVNYLPAGPWLSWTENGVDRTGTNGAGITRALRYKASSLFRGAGSSNTRMGASRAFITPRHIQPRATLGVGNLQGRPVIRNRLQSFGSRVPPVNRGAAK
jgi:hypothetical protein